IPTKGGTAAHISHVITASMGGTGLTPHDALNRQAALVGPLRMSAAMEAVMARSRGAFATSGAHLVIGTEVAVPPHDRDAPTKSLYGPQGVSGRCDAAEIAAAVPACLA